MASEAIVYTHGHHESVLRSHRQRDATNSASYLLPYLHPGMTLLDVGCGPGTITVDFARILGSGQVVGIDRSAPIVAEAQETHVATRASAAGEAKWAELSFSSADLYALPFADGSFDVVHAHQVLQHVARPVDALREMGRVCRPGGIVAARDSDYAAMTWYPASKGLDSWLDAYRAAARRNGAEPDAGRHLLAWARASGFAEITASASAWCWSTPDERSWWGGLWAERITLSALADQIVAYEIATAAECQEMASAWQEWAADPDGWFAVLHGEVICRKAGLVPGRDEQPY